MATPRPTAITTRITHSGVSDFARETVLSQGYVCKLLAWGGPVDGIRARQSGLRLSGSGRAGAIRKAALAFSIVPNGEDT